ncbi:myosin type-2 heavy chain 1 [Schizosaccharomyces japonicus yFS275]|uniref:Myosin type-2 heavy chain 1 n=1 Tax=Schizosaccharomyces japonicus (strain yFS275 / FY16936) TaxID=402676 RepID=B6K4Y8_SCHJY|nr:myosin type-2 heavy chain 1 [Schizosaccharomyces japonicus yFS275]EEB08545.1 myosin type-2 heavy chain 1 [Schizosaccharomyces japonicus yFS275]
MSTASLEVLGINSSKNDMKEQDDKRWVWIPDPENAFVKACVIEELKDHQLRVRYNNFRDEKIVLEAETLPVNPSNFDSVDDMAELTHLNEPSIAYNLEQRYMSDLIYTYSGLFLVAINPYNLLPIYNKDIIQLYKDKTYGRKYPHIFSVADLAYNNLLEKKEHQSILVTGESGAGKTENTKRIIQYLASVANSSQYTEGQIEEQILQTNPILESFGNAQTVRNNNSSRFGKFIRIEFSASGEISNATIDWYLLEKSRVVRQSPEERSYHVFYQLIKGADEALRNKLLLSKTTDEYNYLKESSNTIDGVDDAAEFEKLLASMKTLNFTEQEMIASFKILSIVLLLGNITVVADRNGAARLPNPDEIDKICHLMGMKPEEFSQNLIRPKIRAGREWVFSARSQVQVASSLEALAKTIYERNFGWLVDRINQSLKNSGTTSRHFIGILDIAGFEIFKHNSFEQLCINYTNERLQQFFNHHMFVLEQEEYMRESIKWEFQDFGHDLQPTIDLIEKSKPIGILSCLDEECVMPKATDTTFTEKLNALWNGKSTKYKPSKFGCDGFTLTHYAADVEYKTEGWLEKNSDPLNENVANLIANSSNKHLASLFADYKDPVGSVTRTSKKKGVFRTVAQRHKEQLNQLMNQFGVTNPHFVRCIVPNQLKKAHVFNWPLVLEQLRCNGVLEGIRITRSGFPNRLTFNDFRLRYEIMVNVSKNNQYVESRKASLLILQELDVDSDLYRIGISKVFFRAGVLAILEKRRTEYLQRLMTGLQSCIRGAAQRKRYQKTLNAITASKLIEKNLYYYKDLAQFSWAKLFLTIRPLLSSTQNDEKLKKKDEELARVNYELKKSQASFRQAEDQRKATEDSIKNLEKVLETERSIAVDKEEILYRTQEKVNDLLETISKLESDISEKDERVNSFSEEMELLVKEHTQLVEASTKTDNELFETKEKLEAVLASNEELDEKVSTLTASLASANSQNEQLARENKSLSETVDELTSSEKNREELERAINELNTKWKSREQELLDKEKALEEELQTSNDNFSKLQEEKEQAQKQFKEALQSSNDVSAKLQQEKEQTQKQYEDALQKANDKSTRLQTEKDQVQSQLDQLRSDLKHSRSRFDEISKEGGELQAKLKRLEEANDDLESMKKIQQLTISDLEEKVSFLEADLKQLVNLKNEVADLKLKNGELQEQLSDMHVLKEKLNQRDNTLRSYSEEIDSLRSEVNTLQGYRDKYNALSSQSTSLKSSADKLKGELDQIKVYVNKFLHAEEELNRTRLQLNTSNEANSMLNEKIDLLTKERDSLEGEVHHGKERISLLQDTIQRQRGDLASVDELKDKIRTFESQISQLKGELKEEKNKVSTLTQYSKEAEILRSQLKKMQNIEEELNKAKSELKQVRSLRSEIELLKGKVGSQELLRSKNKELELRATELRKELSSVQERTKRKEQELQKLKTTLENEKMETKENLQRMFTPQRKTIFDLHERNASQAMQLLHHNWLLKALVVPSNARI